LIFAGKVKVNGKIIKDPNAYVAIDSKLIVDQEQVTLNNDQKILICFNKPKNVVTTSSDEQGRKTVYDLLPDQYKKLKAVGRLDMATTGLLLFTNDNNLANYLLDPINKIPRTYVVTVKGNPNEQSIALMQKGIKDQNEILKAKSIEVRKSSNKESILIITLTEGKNREIRRLCKAVGHEVIKLKRISFGQIELGDLAPCATKEVDMSKFKFDTF
jgi:23S rRNA pseudouridine2605 synthase